MEIDSLRELYVDELKDLYSAEKQILKALPKMVKKATDAKLKAAFQDHLEVTQRHVERLEQVFEAIGKSPRGKKCKAMEGLLEEGKETMQEDMAPEVMDAALIAAAQRVEHYEMAGYGTVRTWAQAHGRDGAGQDPPADPRRGGGRGPQADQARREPRSTSRPWPGCRGLPVRNPHPSRRPYPEPSPPAPLPTPPPSLTGRGERTRNDPRSMGLGAPSSPGWEGGRGREKRAGVMRGPPGPLPASPPQAGRPPHLW